MTGDRTDKHPYFKLPKSDRLHLEIEEQEKAAKNTAAEAVLRKLDSKYTNGNTRKDV